VTKQIPICEQDGAYRRKARIAGSALDREAAGDYVVVIIVVIFIVVVSTSLSNRCA